MSRRRIAYILKGFPRLSETFIANEVKLLSEMGLQVGLFSIKAGDALAVDPDLPPVCYLPPVTSLSSTSLSRWLISNFPTFRSDFGYWMRRSPWRFLRTLAFALRCALQYTQESRTWLKKSFIKEFFLASYAARKISEAGDFVHIHAHFCHDATTVAWMASRLTGIPFSFTAHAKDIYQKRLNPGDLLPRKLAATTFAVTCTQANAAYLRDRSSRPEKIHGIYHGLDTKMFIPQYADAGWPDGTSKTERPKLLSIGRMVEKKGFKYLIAACALLRDRSVDFELDIIGERGDQSQIIEELIRHHDLQNQINLVPPLPQRALTGHYQSARAFVLPCIVLDDGDRDGIPNVMAEAMACAVPVVVTGISGIPEIVEDGVHGLIVPPREVGALAIAVERLLRNPQLAKRLGSAGRVQIESVFDAHTTHKSLKVLFDDVLASTV